MGSENKNLFGEVPITMNFDGNGKVYVKLKDKCKRY
jgi:hypothetical protein